MYNYSDNTYLIPHRRAAPYVDDLSYLLDINIGNDRSSLVGYTCAMAYMCQYITAEELSSLIAPEFGKDAMRRRYTRLVKSGILRADKFKTSDGHSHIGYCLTKKGIAAAREYFPRESFSEVKVRRSGGYVPEHDYSCGMNILSALYMRIPFFWQKEYVLPGKYKVLRAVRSDCVLVTRFNDPHIIFIEQDMGNEKSNILVDKIGAYGDHGIQYDSNFSVIFSCRNLPSQAFSNTLFRVKWIKGIKDTLAALSLNGVYELYELLNKDNGSSLPDIHKNLIISNLALGKSSGCTINSIAVELKRFLVLTGTCKIDELTPAADMTKIMVSDIELLPRINTMTTVTKQAGRDFMISDIDVYLDQLDSYNNVYRIKYQNVQQCNNSFNTLIGMLSIYKRLLDTSNTSRDEVLTILSGLPVYVVPTSLFARKINHVLPVYFNLPSRQKNLIGDYYGVPALYYTRVGLGNYSTTDADRTEVILRNCFVIYTPAGESLNGFTNTGTTGTHVGKGPDEVRENGKEGENGIENNKNERDKRDTKDISMDFTQRTSYLSPRSNAVLRSLSASSGASNYVNAAAGPQKYNKSNDSEKDFKRSHAFYKATAALKSYKKDCYLISYNSRYDICDNPYMNAAGSRVSEFDYDNCIISESELDELNARNDMDISHGALAEGSVSEVPYNKGLVCYTSICSLSSLAEAYYIANFVDIKETEYSYVHFIFECETKAQMKRAAVLLGFDDDYGDYLEKDGFKVSFSLPGDKSLYRVYGYGEGIETPDDIVFPISPAERKEVEQEVILRNLADLM